MLTTSDGHQKNVVEHLGAVGKAAIVVVLTPMLVAHFFIMMLPMRIAYAATVRDSTERDVEVVIKADKERVDQGDGEGSKAMPLTGDTQGEKEPSEIGVNAMPALMRENLARPELGLQR